jgi:hypothetical protein
VLGIFAVFAVFALVGLTLWKPLSVVIAVPVILVLTLVIRAAVPVPPPARLATAGNTGGRAATRPRPGTRGADTAGPRRPVSSRYSDRPPYDQEADQPRRGAPRRRPPEPGLDPMNPTEVMRPVAGPRRATTPPVPGRGDAPATEVYGRGPGRDDRAVPPPAAARRHDDRYGDAVASTPRQPAYPPVDGGGYDDRRDPRVHARPASDGYGDDEYGDYEDPYGGRDGRHRAGESTRWWRRPAWDDDVDLEPEPEPDEEMMHTMSLDLRKYLDDTGSFRIP